MRSPACFIMDAYELAFPAGYGTLNFILIAQSAIEQPM